MVSQAIKSFVFLTLSVLISFSTLAHSKPLPTFTILTEDWPPYQYLEKGKITGFSVDVLELLLQEAGANQNRNDFQIVPWARGVKILEQQANAVLFLMTRTAERNPKYKWVGPLFKNTSYVFAKKGSEIQLKANGLSSQYKAGSVIEDISRDHLIKLGIKDANISKAVNSESLISMLYHGRFDILVDNLSNFVQTADSLAFKIDEFEIVGVANEEDVAFAFNINTPDWVIKHLQGVFDDLVNKGQISFIREQYDINDEAIIPQSLQ